MFSQRKKFISGFTLIELMITLSIFVIITAVVLFSQRSFNSSIVLTNLSYDIALAVRQAQTFGIGGKSSGFTGNIKPTYGVHFETTGALGENKVIVFFADYNGDKILSLQNEQTNSIASQTFCTSDISPECIQKQNLTRGNIIKKICDLAIPANCYSVLDIAFQRPNVEPIITVRNSTSDPSPGILHSGMKITLGSSDGVSERYVTVGPLGNINTIR